MKQEEKSVARDLPCLRASDPEYPKYQSSLDGPLGIIATHSLSVLSDAFGRDGVGVPVMLLLLVSSAKLQKASQHLLLP